MYIVQRKSMIINGEDYERNDKIGEDELSEKMIERFIDRGHIVSYPEDIAPDQFDVSETQPEIDLSQGVNDLKDKIKAITSLRYVEQLMAEESQNKDRKTIQDWLTKKKKELE